MSIALKQSAGAFVKPVDDARLYNLFSSGQTGIVEGCEITHLGANQLQISSGWGICQGRMFTVEQETIAATVSASGQVNGRLLIHIDVSSENPASFQTQAAAELPQLTQEDINSSGTVFELELAGYKVDELSITALQLTADHINPVGEAIQALAESIASELARKMPVYGGEFTGNVKAYETARTTRGLFNDETRAGSTTGALQAV